MKEQAKLIVRIVALLCITTLLHACGGSSEKASTYSISANVSSVSFDNQYLTENTQSIKVSVTFEGNGLLVGYAPDVEPMSWMNFRTENVTDTSADVFIDVINADLSTIFIDLHQTKIRLSSGDITTQDLVHHDIDVSLLVWQALTFTETFGIDVIESQTLEFSNPNNEWSISTDVDWLSIETSYNDETQKSTVIVIPTVTTVANAGYYQGNLVYTGPTGQTKQTVELGLDDLRLYADKPVVAFTSTKNIKVTEQTILVNTNSLASVDWSVSSDSAWLTVTPIPDTEQFRIVANADLLPNNTTSTSLITISSINDDTINDEVVSVSLYKNDSIINNEIISNITVNDDAFVAAPGLPLVYLGINNEINVYNQYTAELISSIPVSPAETLLEEFIIHPQGQLLLAKAVETVLNTDENGNDIETQVTHRYQIDLTDYSVMELQNPEIQGTPINFIRLQDRYYVLTQFMEFADQNLNILLSDENGFFRAYAADVAQKTNTLFISNVVTQEINRFTVKVNNYTSKPLKITRTHTYRPETLQTNDFILQMFVTADEKNIYLHSPTSQWLSFDGTNFTDEGLLENNTAVTNITLAKSNNDRLHFLRFGSISTQPDALGVYLEGYNEQQQVTAKTLVTSNLAGDIALSADDKKLLINSTLTKELELINIKQFTLSTDNIEYSNTWGEEAPNSQTVTLSGIGDNWQASVDVPWLVITQDLNNEQDKLHIAIDPTTISTWGLYTGTITLYDPSSDTFELVNVNFAVDEIRLFGNYPALTFNNQVDKSTLNHTVQILTNSDSDIPWQATSSVDWLSLTTDTINNTLTLIADPDKVEDGGLNYGQITLSPVNDGDSITGVIEVSFNKGNYDTNSQTEIVIDNISPNNDAIALDPLRPYLYVAQSDHIDVYSIINGDKITSIISPLVDVDLSNLVIHPDGSILFASNTETYTDENQQEQTRVNHYVINLNDFSIAMLNENEVSIQNRPEIIAMISGKPVVITQALEYANLALERQYWDTDNLVFTSAISDIKGNNDIFAHDQTASSLIQHTLQYNSFAGITSTVVNSNSYINSGFTNAIGNITASSDGSAIYTANTQSEWSSFDQTSFVDQGVLHNSTAITVNIETDSNDNSYIYRYDLVLSLFVLSKYDNTQQPLWTVGFSAGSGDSYISPNYHRMIHYNQADQTLVLDYIPD